MTPNPHSEGPAGLPVRKHAATGWAYPKPLIWHHTTDAHMRAQALRLPYRFMFPAPISGLYLALYKEGLLFANADHHKRLK